MLQCCIAGPFLFTSSVEHIKAYWTSAFDFSRRFLYEWTVNWRFLAEPDFSSDRFAKVLLGTHVSTLLVALALFDIVSWYSL